MNLSRRRRIRKIRYFLGYGLRHFAFFGIGLTYRLIIRNYRKTVYHGISLADGSMNTRDVSIFINATKAALQLIQQNDPRRFRMLQHEVRTIFNVELLESANYMREYRQVSVDIDHYREHGRSYLDKDCEHYEWYLASYAAKIVHEATHGRLFSLYFPYNKITRVRCERICRAEQRRFAARLKSENYDFSQGLIPKFAEQDWDFSWKTSRWERTKQTYRRYQEAKKQVSKNKSEVSD